MAKLADIRIYLSEGGASFNHSFPCYVGSDGVFSVITTGWDSEIAAFVKDDKSVKITSDREGRQRLSNSVLADLEATLKAFAKDMMSGERQTRIFIHFDPSIQGTAVKSDNGQFGPWDFHSMDNRVDMGGGEYGGRRDPIQARPSISLVEVTRTKTKSGKESFSTILIHRSAKDSRDDVGPEGKRLADWSPVHIGPSDWWRVKKHAVPYDEPTAARINLMMERLVGACYDMAQLRDEDHGDLFPEES